MDKKTFNKITKNVFTEYGFIKQKNAYILLLDEVTIVVKFCSWRGVKSFDYYFSINNMHDSSIPLDKRYDCISEIKMEHSPSAQGYHQHEILFEEYSEDEYRDMLTKMLHSYFDPYKEDALQFLKVNYWELTTKAREHLGLI